MRFYGQGPFPSSPFYHSRQVYGCWSSHTPKATMTGCSLRAVLALALGRERRSSGLMGLRPGCSYGRLTRSLVLSNGDVRSRRMRPARPRRPTKPRSPHEPELSSRLSTRPVRGDSAGVLVWSGPPGGVPGACASATGMAIKIMIPTSSPITANRVCLKAPEFIETSSIDFSTKVQGFPPVYYANLRV